MPRKSQHSTAMEDKILLYIKQTTNEKGFPPSVREICEAVGLASTSTVHAYLIRLEKRGLLKRNVLKPRALEIVDPLVRKSMVSVPVVGKVTAGAPILAVESITDTFPLPTDFLKDDSPHFILSVRGDSMVEAGIVNDDMVVVRQQSAADNGDIVVAIIDDEATVKRYYKENDTIHLIPENRMLEPIIVKNAEILGRVIGLIRSFDK